MNEYEERSGFTGVLAPEGEEDLDTLQRETDWFVEVDEGFDTKNYYRKTEIGTILRAHILQGRYPRDNTVVIHTRAANGEWELAESTLFEFAKRCFQLRVLYQPVWSHAIAGLMWGAIVGAFLKLADSFYGLSLVDPQLAILFAAATGVWLIRKISTFASIAIIVILLASMGRFGLPVVLMMGLAGLMAAFLGAVLGCLPGMGIGGLIGTFRKHSLPQAEDAIPERPGIWVKAALLPLVGGSALLAFYIFVVTPWIFSLLLE